MLIVTGHVRPTRAGRLWQATEAYSLSRGRASLALQFPKSERLPMRSMRPHLRQVFAEPMTRSELLLGPPETTGDRVEDILEKTRYAIRLYQTYYMRSARRLEIILSSANAAVIVLGSLSSIAAALTKQNDLAYVLAIILPIGLSVTATLATTFRLRDKLILRSRAIADTIDLVTEFRQRRAVVKNFDEAKELRDGIRVKLLELDKKQWRAFHDLAANPADVARPTPSE
jgi:hypothetical protein